MNAERATVSLPRILVRLGLLAVFAAGWFGIAGRVAWGQGWALLSLFLVSVIALMWRLARTDPGLLEERSRMADNVEPWDKILMRVYGFLGLIFLVVAALDGGRFGWSVVPFWAQAFGWVLVILAGRIVWHVTTANPFLSRWARIQEDRGHVVVSGGLYSRVRHPMYLGIIILFVGLSLALASWLALIPGALIACLFVYRTSREERMLIEGLSGDAEYTEKVKYRLIPGIW